jgi:hypothetical protein
MTFFNKKEEVIYFKLTPHGRHLLSMGKFKPKFYSFFDDNILYAPEYADFEQKQNDIETRIQENTPYDHAQHIYSSVERNLNELEYDCSNAQYTIKRQQHIADKHYSLSMPIGTTDVSSLYAPAWQTIFLRSELSSSVEYITGSFATSKIPQLDVKVPYEVVVVNGGKEHREWAPNNKTYTITEPFEDGTSIAIEGDYIMLDILENNTDFLKENFTIEVFEVQKEETSGSAYTPGLPDPRHREKLIPLSFMKRHQEIRDGFLLDASEIERTVNPILNLDETCVEHYFDIRSDNQISPVEICNSLHVLERKNIYLDIGINPVADCPDQQSAGDFQTTYGTDITEEDADQC